MRVHGLELTEVERVRLTQMCGIGFMSLEEIYELADDVSFRGVRVKR